VSAIQVCIFAYGQTGSGKTYTMMGKPGNDQKGIIPRSLEQIFKTSRFLESQGWNYSMQVSISKLFSFLTVVLFYVIANLVKTYLVRCAGINVGNIQ
jgi:hypothetical protein